MASARTVGAPVLLFDLGGVVIDIDFDRVFSAWGSSAGCDPELLRGRFSFDDVFETHERGELADGAFYEHLRSVLAVDLTDAALERGWNDIYLGEVPGMDVLLREASAAGPIYAFTNTNAVHQRHWNTAFAPVLSAFEEIFASCELGLRKPEPEAFRTVAARIGVDPGDVHFFDDSPVNVDAARAAGMAATVFGSVDDVRRVLGS
jgi:HAD superfamily hydrolase (TIGR01509 family)